MPARPPGAPLAGSALGGPCGLWQPVRPRRRGGGRGRQLAASVHRQGRRGRAGLPPRCSTAASRERRGEGGRRGPGGGVRAAPLAAEAEGCPSLPPSPGGAAGLPGQAWE